MSEQQTQAEDRQPTKEELVNFLTESLEIAKLRSELQGYNTQIAVGRAEELKALMFIAQLTNPQPQEEPEEEEDKKEFAEHVRKLKKEKPTE